MIQRLILCLAIVFGMSAPSVFGLELSEIILHSARHQRFSAEIELTHRQGLKASAIQPKLASQADFDRAHVTRDQRLTDLRFEVATKDDGRQMILITSSQPILEPFLSFVIEVLWPTGRTLREYTIFLDLPMLSEPVSMTQALSHASTTSIPTEIEIGPQLRENISQQTLMFIGEYRMTRSGDTLWRIASEVRPDSSLSVQQKMLAIRRANTTAFVEGNINQLKAGEMLSIPDIEQIRHTSHTVALQEIRYQNEQFYTYHHSQLRRLDAVKEQVNNLAMAVEELDGMQRVNAGLKVHLKDLQEQLDTLQESLKLKDEQLAILEAEIQKPILATALLINPMVLAVLVVLAGFIISVLIMLWRKQKAVAQKGILTLPAATVKTPAVKPGDETGNITDADPLDLLTLEDDLALEDETNNRLDLARAYIDMGDSARARDLLQKIINAGLEEDVKEAKDLLERLG